MRQQLIQYVGLLFAGSPENVEMRQEILQNTLDRYDDLIAQGKSPEAAYRLAISGIGDINEVLASPADSAPAQQVPAGNLTVQQKKLMRAVSIGMYICAVVPVIILGSIGNGAIGVCLMFMLIAAATVLMILSSGDQRRGARQDSEEMLTPQQKARKPIYDILNTLGLVLFFATSFLTGAWHITWIIFPIMGAVKGIINACLDLKEENK